MGKAGRIACIFTPMALTIASFICLVLIEVAGWNKGMLPTYDFFSVNTTAFDPNGSGEADQILNIVHTSVAQEYRVYLWNYCESSTTSTKIDNCVDRESGFVFDPLQVLGLSITNTTNQPQIDANGNVLASAKGAMEGYEDQILGDSGRKALDAYKKVAKWMFIAYQVSTWVTLGTIVFGLLAIFSRWGSLITWILAFVSSFFTIAAVLTSTILFSVLVSALNKALEPYNITLTLGHQAMVVGWLSVAFSWAATLFWLFSICCCSGRSNPHHRSNKGGLWNAEPKGQGYGRGSMSVEKTGGLGLNRGYQRVSSPYMGAAAHHDSDTVPLQDYAQQPYGFNHHQGAGYEPYRHV